MDKVCYISGLRSHWIPKWLNFFAQNGWKVDLITYDHIDNWSLHKNVVVHAITRPLPNLNLPIMIYRIRKLIKKINPDIIHAHGFYGVHAAFANFNPVILTEWGLSHTKKGDIGKILEKIGYKKADIITVACHETKRVLINKYNLSADKFKLIPWGVDTRIFYKGYDKQVRKLKQDLAIPENSFMVINIRPPTSFYGIQYIISAIPKVIKKHPSTIFLFLKGYTLRGYLDKIKHLAKEKGFYDNVRFVDELVPYNMMPVYLNVADVSVHMTLMDNGSAALTESMACGAIVIGTNHEFYRERIKDGVNGFLIQRNSDAIAEKINYCIEHPEIKDKIYENNKEIIYERENWEKCSKQMEDLYYQLIENYAHK